MELKPLLSLGTLLLIVGAVSNLPPLTPPLNAPKILDINVHSAPLDTEAMGGAAVSAVIPRASYGDETDAQIMAFVTQLQAAGIAVPALYHYYDPAVPWRDQYDALSAVMDETGVMRAAVYLDETAGASAGVRDFLAELQADYPLPLMFKHIVYTSAESWTELGSPVWGSQYELWLAEWTAAPVPTALAPWKSWKLWQYTVEADGPSNGVSTLMVGVSRFNGSSLQFESWLKMMMVRSGVPTPR